VAGVSPPGPLEKRGEPPLCVLITGKPEASGKGKKQQGSDVLEIRERKRFKCPGD